MNTLLQNLGNINDRDTIGTSNKLFNELIGGGFDTQRYHVILGISSTLDHVKELIPEHNSIVLMETKLGEAHKHDGHTLRNKALAEDLAYINLMEVPTINGMPDFFNDKQHYSNRDHYEQADTFMMTMEVPEGISVKISKQRKRVQHGYPNPCHVKL